MHRTLAIARTIVLATGVAQIVLGMLFWLDLANGLVPVHASIGTLLVLSLLVEAFAAARLRVPRGLVLLVVLWALVIPVVGLGQTSVLPGSAHWIVQVVHFALGLGALGLASILAARVDPAEPTPESAKQPQT